MEHSPGQDSPFKNTVDAAAYIPRAETDRVLARIEEAVERGDPITALVGPPGLGKSLLLHVLAERLSLRFRTAYVPFATVPAEEVYSWLLSHIDEEVGEGEPGEAAEVGEDAAEVGEDAAEVGDAADVGADAAEVGDAAEVAADAAGVGEDAAGLGEDDEAAREGLLRIARAAEREGSALVLLVDEVGSLSPEAAGELADLSREAGSALRLVVAAADDERSAAVLDGLGDGLEPLSFDTPMSAAETEAYVRAGLNRSKLPEHVCARFDSAAIEELHRASGGIARLLNEEVLARLGPEPAPGRTALVADPAEAATPAEVEKWSVASEAPAGPAPIERRRRTGRRLATRVALGLLGLALGALWYQSGLPEPMPGEAGVRIERATQAAPPAAPIRINVNARPWARIELDGVDLGLTPLGGVPVAPGSHRFRATMPDGSVLERVEILGPDNRRVTFP